MLVSKVLWLAFATLVAAQGDMRPLGTVFAKSGFNGPSRTMAKPGECVGLPGPLCVSSNPQTLLPRLQLVDERHSRNNVHSIMVTDGAQCDLFVQPDCQQLRRRFYNSQSVIDGPAIALSVRCLFQGDL
ncbi:hypothetical protein TOPH_00878 [Tolypocladium ophioglossoides CBS 100239]|uniref:Ecp2 effector protein domain-containing protein n=1 Tax=Tolypocladium ophioglossoides (strain CBS 100239) TaxID=1163406 RepID=A0A0L0NKE6_TOLOC|nr:hypothetical protein TOPH_00878 [Tolypocladium ophioglossoides CBS 100239]